ncbi:YcaO-like family protein [Aeromonas bestiarum]|uniref:YcaO-like family protein n=1 Tax=Aeromonas bestiarum TaxID=105751 RepID=UPI003670EAF0
MNSKSHNRQSGEEISIPPNFPKSVPIAEYRTVQLSADLYFAIQELSDDPCCPNGIFSTAVAIDRTANSSLIRARYEAAERFALAAVHGGHQFVPNSMIDSFDIFEFPIRLNSPLNGHGRSSDTIFLEFSETFNMKSKYIAAADVFAPYPIIDGECCWHPTTNGVAVGRGYESARFASFCELLERHSIMKYWHEGGASYLVGEKEIRDSATPEAIFLDDLGYELICLEISTINSIFVVLSFAKNKNCNYPFLVCSAGSAQTLSNAIRKAAQETVQTLVACAGQTAEFSRWKDKGSIINSLEHRMYYYADTTNHDSINEVVAGAMAEALNMSDRPPCTTTFSFDELQQLGITAAFVDITPESWNGLLSCVRCYSSTMIPLLVSESMVKKTPSLAAASRFALPHPFP